MQITSNFTVAYLRFWGHEEGMGRSGSALVKMGFMSKSRKKDWVNKEAGNRREDRRQLTLHIMITS